MKWHFAAKDLAVYPPKDPARDYAADVVAHPHRHNRWVHLACKRHTLDLLAAAAGGDAFPFFYDWKLAGRPARFASEFKNYTGPHAGKQFQHLDWQRFIIAMLYGWRMKSDPVRKRFTYCYMEVPRKNGKTALIGPLGLYEMAFSPRGAMIEVFSVGMKKDQAKIVWNDGCSMLASAKQWLSAFRKRVASLAHIESGSIWTPVSSDANTLDGLRPEMVIMDELHKWNDEHLWTVFNNAMGAAISPLIFQITTAGNSEDTICYKQHGRVTDVLEAVEKGGEDYDPTDGDAAFYLGCIWTIDEGDKWDNEETWWKANPSLGPVKTIDSLRKEMDACRASVFSRRAFLRDHLNVWNIADENTWLDIEKWQACEQLASPLTHAQSWARLAGLKCFGGFDSSNSRDLTVLCFVARNPRDTREVICAFDVWVPGAELGARIAKEDLPYDEWMRDGWIIKTEGDCIDINVILAACVERRKDVDLTLFGFDPGYSHGIGIKLANDHEFPAFPSSQGYALAPALQMIDRLVGEGNLKHAGNPVAEAHASRATISQGDVKIRLAKGKTKAKIDCMAALAMAMHAMQSHEASPNNCVIGYA